MKDPRNTRKQAKKEVKKKEHWESIKAAMEKRRIGSKEVKNEGQTGKENLKTQSRKEGGCYKENKKVVGCKEASKGRHKERR